MSGESITGTPKSSGFEYFRHLHAYVFAQPLTKNKMVLEIGCGDGYGIEQLVPTELCFDDFKILKECRSDAVDFIMICSH
jgi:hypothetical protein